MCQILQQEPLRRRLCDVGISSFFVFLPGTYGKVHEAYDVKENRWVAIKMLNRRRLRKIRDGEDNVRREIFIMQRLRHEKIVQLLDVFDADAENSLFVVLELIGGGTLQTKLENRGGQMGASEARWYINQCGLYVFSWCKFFILD